MLSGHKIVLRGWRESDVEALLELRNDEALQSQLMTQPRPNSAERVRLWLKEKSDREDTVFFVIASRSDDAVLGYVQAINLNLLHRTGELGICLAPLAQRKGFGRDTLVTLERYLGTTFGLRKLILYVLADNIGAMALYRGCQYVEAGRFSRHFFSGGKYQDVVIMEKLL